jgi:hypothetical protein
VEIKNREAFITRSSGGWGRTAGTEAQRRLCIMGAVKKIRG